MGCAMSNRQYLFENPFESENWLEKNKYRLFWKATELNLSRAELAGLTTGWKKVNSMKNPLLAQTALLCAFEKCPGIREAYGNKFANNVRLCPKFLNHARIYQDTLDMIVTELSLAKQEEVCPKLVTFGAHHAFLTRKRFEHHYWCAFGQALLESAKREFDVSNAFLRGWKKLIQCLIASMQIGYAIGFSQDELPARFAFRKAVVDNELFFFPISKEAQVAENGLGSQPRALENCCQYSCPTLAAKRTMSTYGVRPTGRNM